MSRSDIFISYCHKDAKWLEQLLTHLKPLERDDNITVWKDTDIQAGDKWKDKIRTALERAKVAVLLVTPNFLDSDFIHAVELPHFLKASETNGLRILWIAVSASRYRGSAIEQFQSANNPEKPLDILTKPRRNQELVKITEKIAQAVNPLGARRN